MLPKSFDIHSHVFPAPAALIYQWLCPRQPFRFKRHSQFRRLWLHLRSPPWKMSSRSWPHPFPRRRKRNPLPFPLLASSSQGMWAAQASGGFCSTGDRKTTANILSAGRPRMRPTGMPPPGKLEQPLIPRLRLFPLLSLTNPFKMPIG